MNNEFKLQTLLDLSHARMDDAARQLGQLLASEQEGVQKLAMLEQYRDEYQRRFLEAAREGLGREQWSNYQAFLARLEEAITQQHKALDLSRQQTSEGQKAWLGQRNRAKAFDTLSERHRAQLQRASGKAEQKMTDEHAAKGSRDGEGEDGAAS